MPPGPPNLGENRFAVLSESPKTKKKKRPYQKFSEEFPELPETVQKNPKFIIITAKNSTKTISEFSCFAVRVLLVIQ